MEQVITVGMFAAGLRMAVPILLAALGGLFTDRVNIFNVALEGMMLVGAFAAVLGSILGGSAWVGLGAAVLAGLSLALIFGWFTLWMRADPIMVGIALNLFAGGLTIVLMQAVFGARGSFVPGNIALFPVVTVPFADAWPFIGRLLGGNNLIFYAALIAAPLVHVFLYHSRTGLRIRAVGERTEAAQAVGVRPRAYQWLAVLLSGALAGVGGAYLSLSSLGMFSENMTAGRGFVALAAIFFGRSTPVGILLAALFFGIAESAAIRLQGLGLSTQLVLMVPYAAAVVSLAVSARGWRRKARASGAR